MLLCIYVKKYLNGFTQFNDERIDEQDVHLICFFDAQIPRILETNFPDRASRQDDISRLPNNKWKRTFQLGGSLLTAWCPFLPWPRTTPNAHTGASTHRSLGSPEVCSHTPKRARIHTLRYKEASSWRMRTLCAHGVRCLLLLRRNLDPYGSFTARCLPPHDIFFLSPRPVNIKISFVRTDAHVCFACEVKALFNHNDRKRDCLNS